MADLFSPVIVGTMRLGQWGARLSTPQLQEFIEQALSFGFHTFDHADIYGDYTTESDFGKVLQGNSTLRSKLKLITKCGIKLISKNRPNHQIKSYDSSGEHIIRSVENSLRNLCTDVIDVLLLHRPDVLLWAEEIASAVTKLQEAGKIIHFGVSNYSAAQMELLHSYVPLITNQIEISPLAIHPFSDGTLDVCQRLQIRPTAWSPFAGGVLFSESSDTRVLQIQKVAARLSLKYDVPADQIYLAWVRTHPLQIIPVVGTTKITKLQSAYQSLTCDLSREDWYKIYEASLGHEVP